MEVKGRKEAGHDESMPLTRTRSVPQLPVTGDLDELEENRKHENEPTTFSVATSRMGFFTLTGRGIIHSPAYSEANGRSLKENHSCGRAAR